MNIEQFIQAIEDDPCCATCRFFVARAFGFVFRRKDKLTVSGSCRRYPPVFIGDKAFEAEGLGGAFGHPPISIVVEPLADELSGTGLVSSDGTSGFTEAEPPWCGEYERGETSHYEILEMDEDEE